MKKVLVYSILLIVGLVGSQFIGEAARGPVAWLTMAALAFIMVHVGYEFDLDKSRVRTFGADYLVAAAAATLPWVLCAGYFLFVMVPPGLRGYRAAWEEALLKGLFSAPTSAGVLFSMLAAAGLGATWVFAKARVLAIFDDLHTLLLLIPLKVVLVGPRWQLAGVLLVMGALLVAAWRWLHAVRIPVTWPWVLAYSAGITLACEGVYASSKLLDPSFPVHLEVLLPAFALGCIMRRPPGADPHRDDARENVEEGPETAAEQRVSTVVSATFMVLVGLSMPSLTTQAPETAATTAAVARAAYADVPAALLAAKDRFPGWGVIAAHVAAITVLSNLGKLVPAVCYRREAEWRERLALAVGMFPRGEVGAGVLVIALDYGMAGPGLTVAVLSLAVNLLLTGVFIVVVKRLLQSSPREAPFPVAGGAR